MTNIERLRAMSLDEFSLWLDENALFDNSPWMNWFDKEYCEKCEAEKVMMKNGEICPCVYCEIHEHCRFFPDVPIPVNYDIISGSEIQYTECWHFLLEKETRLNMS